MCRDRKRSAESTVSLRCSNEMKKRKKCRVRVNVAVIGIDSVGTPLTSRSTGCPCDSLLLEADQSYSVGRSRHLCEFLLHDCRVSRRHCQLYFSSINRKLFIVDGDRVGSRKMEEKCGSMNGIFVNGCRCKQGIPSELCEGDEVLLVCGEDQCSSGVKIGFTIRKVVPLEDEIFSDRKVARTLTHSSKRIFASTSSSFSSVVHRAKFLLDHCRQILHSADPVYCVRRFPVSFETFLQAPLACNNFPGSRVNLVSRNHGHVRAEPVVEKMMQLAGKETDSTRSESLPQSAAASEKNFNHEGDPSSLHSMLDNTRGDLHPLPMENGFCLNRLESIEHGSSGLNSGISLPELLNPIDNILQIFIATFTSDIQWFLSYCQIPNDMRVTIACHNTDRCWSSDPEKRTTLPYPEFPNIEVVFPPFPEAIAFGGDRKKQGIACHHPKLIVLQREDRMRVVISSANLVAKQWTSITNTVWWQDFPRRNDPDFASLFTRISSCRENQSLKSDFAAQLAGFMASLVIDSSSQATWITQLTNYDFDGARGYLVASIPGIHSYRLQYSMDDDQDTSSTHDLKLLGLVETSAVGLSYFFRTTSDKNGAALKKLATFLSNSSVNASQMLEVMLRRTTNIAADTNAVSILVRDPNNLVHGDCVQFGFLPRNIAKWVAPLWDGGFFRFCSYIYPKEVLGAALERDSRKVQLVLQVFQGPHFRYMSKMLQCDHIIALCSLIASVKRCIGLSRLHEVLGQYNWCESLETDFVYAASSIGTSVNAQFLAAFSAAAGKKSLMLSESEESDPEWGCWTASQELKNPSIGITFPTMERVKNSVNGISPSRRILCFSEGTWKRLQTSGILRDAIPNPDERIGHPMHVKVARRRFKSRTSSSSFGWVYNGSHNFSAAAWGRPILISTTNKSVGGGGGRGKMEQRSMKQLHVCNYELGIIFVVPPPPSPSPSPAPGDSNQSGGGGGIIMNLDDIVLPFFTPPPRYGGSDRPATKQSMRDAVRELESAEEEEEAEEEFPVEDEVVVECRNNCSSAKEDEEVAYADMLWTKVESSLTTTTQNGHQELWSF